MSGERGGESDFGAQKKLRVWSRLGRWKNKLKEIVLEEKNRKVNHIMLWKLQIERIKSTDLGEKIERSMISC